MAKENEHDEDHFDAIPSPIHDCKLRQITLKPPRPYRNRRATLVVPTHLQQDHEISLILTTGVEKLSVRWTVWQFTREFKLFYLDVPL